MRKRSLSPNRSLSLSLIALATFALPVVAQVQGGGIDSVPMLTQSEMSASDVQIVTRMQPAIVRSEQIYGYSLDSSSSYLQIACAAAPHHFLLAYESVAPSGSVSRFTAVFRKSSEKAPGVRSPVQIVPILRSEASPFVAAYSSPHAIKVFNQVVPSTPGRSIASLSGKVEQDPLLQRSLCYMTMVGSPSAALRSPSLEAATLHAPVPTLPLLGKSGMRQMLTAKNGDGTYGVWTLTFAPDGKLLAAERDMRPMETAAPVLVEATTNMSPLPAMPNAASPTSAPSATVLPCAILAETQVVSSVPAVALQALLSRPVKASAPVPTALPLPARRFIPDQPPPPSRLITDSNTQPPQR